MSLALIAERSSAPLVHWKNVGHTPVCFHLRFDSDVSLLEGEYSLQHLHRQTAALCQYFQAQGVSHNTIRPASLLLFHDNSFYFLSALLAANLSGIKVILPASCQPSYLKSLKLSVDFCLVQKSYAVDSNLVIAEHFLDPETISLKAAPDVSQDAEKFASFCDGFLVAPLNMSAELELFTSGSTGAPTVIRKNWGLLLEEVQVLESSFLHSLGPLAKVYSTVSHQHIYGLLFRVLWPLFSGRSFQDMNMLYPESILADMALAESKSILVSSPAQLKRWVEHEQFSQLQQSLALLFSSGGPLPDEAAKSISACLDLGVIEVYGSTETGGVAWRQRTQGNNYSPSWEVFKGVCIGLTDTGCLRVSSPFIHKDLQALDGVYATQDKVLIEGEHKFILQGRADRIIKLEEKRLSLDAMEECIASSDYVDLCKTLVLQHQGKRDCLAAVVVLSEAGRQVLISQEKSALVKLLKAQVALLFERVLLPRKWRFVDVMPSNPQSKTPQLMLSALFEERGLPMSKAAKQVSSLSIDMLAVPSPLRRTLAFAEYHVIEQSDEQIVAYIQLPKSDVLFDAHFPDVALLPGVLQVDWAMQLTRSWFLPAQFVAMQRFKFKAPMMPGQCVKLTISKSKKHKEQLVLGVKKFVCPVSFEFSQIDRISVDAKVKGAYSSGRLMFAQSELAEAVVNKGSYV